MNWKLEKAIMNRKLEKRWDRQRGAISTEYIIILMLVALSLIAIVGKFGKTLMTKFTDSESSVNSQINIQQ